jgi:glutathione S-transferase
MKLYAFPPSPNTWKVRAVAAHLGVPLELEMVDLIKGGSHSPDYLAINPTGRTPGAGRWRSQAVGIQRDHAIHREPEAEFALAERRPRPGRHRALAKLAARPFQQGGLRAAAVPAAGQAALNIGAPDEAVVAKGLECFNKEAKVLDAHLAKQPYLVGKDLTLADFSVAAPLFYADRAGMPLAPYAKLRDWFARVSALPCWRETAPHPVAAAA